MCYEFERWNWMSRAKQRNQKAMPTDSSSAKREEPKPAQAKEPGREVKTPEKVPA